MYVYIVSFVLIERNSSYSLCVQVQKKLADTAFQLLRPCGVHSRARIDVHVMNAMC